MSEHVARRLRHDRQADDQSAEMKRQVASYVNEAHSWGASWADVGAAFGITRQAAHERFHGVNRRRRGAVPLSRGDADSHSGDSAT